MRSSPEKKSSIPKNRPGRGATGKARWSKHVMETSDAMDLEKGAFTKGNAHAIAVSLKHSAESSTRKKTDSFRSAMSMLNFYINRGGKNLSKGRLGTLEKAKQELRGLFGK